MHKRYAHGTVAGLIERFRATGDRSLGRELAGVLVSVGPVRWRGAVWRGAELGQGVVVVVDAFDSRPGIPIADAVELPGPL